VRLAPVELGMVEIPFKDLPLYSYDYDVDFPRLPKPSKTLLLLLMHSSLSRPNTIGQYLVV
jgi:hypothetical protein